MEKLVVLILCIVCHILFRMSLAMDVRCATYSVRLAVDHVEGFVLCLQVFWYIN